MEGLTQFQVCKRANVFICVICQTHVVFAPPVPHGEVPKYIAAADVELSPLEGTAVKKLGSPAMFIEMLGMEYPVVASENPQQERVLSDSEAGICVRSEADSFAAATLELLGDPEKAKRLGRNGRRFVERHRSYSSLADSVEEPCLGLVRS